MAKDIQYDFLSKEELNSIAKNMSQGFISKEEEYVFSIQEYYELMKTRDTVFDKEIESLKNSIEDKNKSISNKREIISNSKKITNKNMLDCFTIISGLSMFGSLLLGRSLTTLIFFRNLVLSLPLPNILLGLKFKSLKKKLWYKDYPTKEKDINDLIVNSEIDEEKLLKRIELDKEFIDMLKNNRDAFDIKEDKPQINEEVNGYINISSRDINKKIYSLEAEIEKYKRLLDTRVTIDYLNRKFNEEYNESKIDSKSLGLGFKVIASSLIIVLFSIFNGLYSSVVVPICVGSVFLGITLGQLNYKFLFNMYNSLIDKAISIGLKNEVSKLGKDYSQLCQEYDIDKIKTKIFDLEVELMKQKVNLHCTVKKEEESLERRKRQRKIEKEKKETISDYSQSFEHDSDGFALKLK